MPKTTKSGKAKQSELPSTLQKSDAKAQRTFAKAHDAAADQYGDDEAAHRVAFSALKHTHEKVGDHWEEKDDYGPSDERDLERWSECQGRVGRGGGCPCNQEPPHRRRAAAADLRAEPHDQG